MTDREYRIEHLILDVDGVLTDGGLYYSSGGEVLKKFNVSDGLAIKRCLAVGVQVSLLSNSLDETLIANRCRTLGIDNYYVGLESKTRVFARWVEEKRCRPETTAYIGDEVNDCLMFEQVGISACPADAAPIVRETADHVLEAAGGRGVIREFVNRFVMDDHAWVERQRSLEHSATKQGQNQP